MDGSDAETGLEIALSWLELYRNELTITGSPFPLLDSLRAVTKTSLLWVRRMGGHTQIVLNDFNLTKDLECRLCSRKGPFHELSCIRFTRHYKQNSEIVTRMVEMGHPKIYQMIAVPIYVEYRVAGVLSILRTEAYPDETFDKMLLSFATVLISMLDTDVGERK